MENKLASMLDAAIAKDHQQKPKRSYLGASRLGEHCARKLQYEFLHTEPDQPFTGKQLRTFAMGHHLESLVTSWMKGAGFDIRTHNKDGQQYRFSAAGNLLAGHIDGVIVAGPDGFIYPALFECKTLNNKSWKDLEKHGLAVNKPGYYVQIQLYMAYMQLTEAPALLVALNKDSSELYLEWVVFDGAVAQKYSDRAVQILQACEASELLPRQSQDPNYFECKWCPYHKTCFGGGL